MSTGKVKISRKVLDDLDLNVEGISCCGLADGTDVGARTTVDELLALRYNAGQNDLDRNAVIVTTLPTERAVYPRLREAGFKEVVEFPSRQGRYKVKLWFALALKSAQVELVEPKPTCNGCDVVLTKKNASSNSYYCRKCW